VKEGGRKRGKEEGKEGGRKGGREEGRKERREGGISLLLLLIFRLCKILTKIKLQ
jgi:predicted transposase YdaD